MKLVRIYNLSLLLLFRLFNQAFLSLFFLLTFFSLTFHSLDRLFFLELSLIIWHIAYCVLEFSQLSVLIDGVVMLLNSFVVVLINMVDIVQMVIALFFSKHLLQLIFSVSLIFVPILKLLLLSDLLHLFLGLGKSLIHLIMLYFAIEFDLFFKFILFFFFSSHSKLIHVLLHQSFCLFSFF